MGNNIFGKFKTAVVDMLKPYEEKDDYDEYEDDFEEYLEDYEETQPEEETQNVKKSKEKKKTTSTKAEEKQPAFSSAPQRSTYGGYIDDLDELDYYEEKKETPKYSFKTNVPPKTEYKSAQNTTKSYTAPGKETQNNSNIFQMKKPNESSSINTMQKFKFSYIKFEKIENAVIVADQMLSGDTVTLIDLHDIPEAMTKRVIDFLDGVRYTCNAKIEVIADLTYVILPEDVELKKDFSSQVDTSGIIF